MKKLIAILCMLTMLIGVVSPAVSAEENDLQAAIAAGAEEVIVLEADAANITITRDTTIDLNGHNIDGVAVHAGTLYIMDSQTADYTVADGVYGHVTNVEGDLKAAEGYLQVDDSFHAVDLDIYAMTLRAAEVGVYYKSNFAADEVVAARVESFGVALSVVTAPNASNLETYCGYSQFTGFEAGEGANSVGTSTLLKNIMKAANSDSKNAKNAAMPVYGRAYIKTAEGYFFGETVKRSLQEQVEAINGVWDTLNYTQKAPILEMLEKFAFAKNSWSVSKMEGVLIPGLDSEIEMPIAVTAENGIVAENTTVSGDAAAITVPAGAQLAAGADTMTLTVTPKAASDADVEKKASEALVPVDVHVTGLVAENAVPVLITLKSCLPAGLNDGNVKLYHVENGVTVAMTRVETPVNHNEFSYDPLTGEVVLAMASFSEVAMLADSNNAWDGKSATGFAGGDGTENNPFKIATAQQLAYFRDQVDGGNNFAGKYITLTSDINLGGVINFDPIGYGYDYDGYTPNGKTFNGTFDGDGHTISGLYQNGWELGYSYCMAGGGLFASVVDATIQDLTITNAYIRMECVDMGILVGLSQGTCIYTDITIKNSKIANYQRSTGGVVGEVSPEYDENKNIKDSSHTFTNITVTHDVVVGSLWGDFDASVGGVIGGRWDDTPTTKVVMNNVKVAARLDVYNDVTSAYQWHAYRRAGMLIGNTDMPAANGKVAQKATTKTAEGETLICQDVIVTLGEWAEYHYCQFTNSNNPGKNYPWVRVEEGENCSAYSNPRYGHPKDVNGQEVTNENHTHQEGDTCNLLITFGQLYGGGQGVYGETKHDGVTINLGYTVTFMQDGKILNVQYIYDNSADVTIDGIDDTAWGNLAIPSGNTFDGWMNAGTTKVTKIDPNNKKNIVLYPIFDKQYTAMFVNQQGDVLASGTFTSGNGSNIKNMVNENEVQAPKLKDFEFDHWEVRITNDKGETTRKGNLLQYNFRDNVDIALYPIYTYNGSVSLIPVDTDGDGETNYYAVDGFGTGGKVKLVEFPSDVNGIPVSTINADSFSSYPDLYAVRIPTSINYVGTSAMAEGSIWNGEEITLYYDGSYADWQKAEPKFDTNWERGMGTNSRVFFLNGGDQVDLTQGYLQFKKNTLSYSGSWSYSTSVPNNLINTYSEENRPDKGYWVAEN